jgi:hypothetical protein
MQSDRLFAPHCLTGIGELPVWRLVELMPSGADPVKVWAGSGERVGCGVLEADPASVPTASGTHLRPGRLDAANPSSGR